ncbi:MAG: GNAT family N-acetyltransferase [Deltaproteobacteria bacterium]|nr:GNAT family N-acetyltransferase [Deltaproteobacteria bacterium]MBW2063909.1 GNAT family N-acetyltransferase [Deltaproteobacteria bacterium]
MLQEIILRKARPEDCDRVYEWRNHPSVRQFSMDPSELGYDEHRDWFSVALQDPQRILLIASRGDEEVGVIRFDLNLDKEVADVSIFVKPEKQRRGVGSLMIRAGEKWLKHEGLRIQKLRATVSKDNRASLTLFGNAGYRPEFIILHKAI